jgi:hypothetical protein
MLREEMTVPSSPKMHGDDYRPLCVLAASAVLPADPAEIA